MSTQGSRFLAPLSLAIGLCQPSAHAQDLSASDLLKKIDQTYRQVSSFSVAAEKKVDLDTDTTLQGIYDRPESRVGPSHDSYDIQVTLMASKSKSKAKLLLVSGKKEIVVVSDGKLVWTLMPAQHTYTEATAITSNTPSPVYLRMESNDISGVYLLLKYGSMDTGRFRRISSSEFSAKLERPETLNVGKDKKECYVLTMQMPGGADKQKLWVDKAEFIVWKSVDTTRRPTADPGIILQTTVTLRLEQLALNPSLDDNNFVFTPPDKAKKVDLLKISGRNPF